MKRYLSLFLALVVICSMVMSGTALAAPPQGKIVATGVVWGITPGTVASAGDSARWIVMERDVYGTFDGPEITGFFDFKYKANIESVDTQAGNLHGVLTAANGDVTLNMVGTNEALTFAGIIVEAGQYVAVYQSFMSGHWNYLTGGKGEGKFSGYTKFKVDTTGHVIGMIPAEFTLTGK